MILINCGAAAAASRLTTTCNVGAFAGGTRAPSCGSVRERTVVVVAGISWPAETAHKWFDFPTRRRLPSTAKSWQNVRSQRRYGRHYPSTTTTTTTTNRPAITSKFGALAHLNSRPLSFATSRAGSPWFRGFTKDFNGQNVCCRITALGAKRVTYTQTLRLTCRIDLCI